MLLVSFLVLTSAPLWECQEFSLANPTWSGNPFDLVATTQSLTSLLSVLPVRCPE